MDEQDKCLGCDTPIYDGGVWGYCSEECLELTEEEVTCLHYGNN